MRVSKLRTGILLIGTGLLLLGNTLGYLSWTLWWDLFKLWPILLIAIGVELIFKNSKVPVLSYISPLLIVLCFVYVAFIGSVFADDYDELPKNSTTFKVTEQEAGQLESLDINLDLSLGDFEFDASDSIVFYGEFEYYGDEPEFKFNKYDNEGEIEVDYKEVKHKFKKMHRSSCFSTIYITDKVPINMDIDAGLVEMVVDLSELNIQSLEMDTGVSDLMIRFGDKSKHIDASFDIGVSDLSVYIPEGTAVRLRKDTGLASVSYSDLGLKKIDKHYYQSANYDSAIRTINISLDAGISDIDIEYYHAGRAEL